MNTRSFFYGLLRILGFFIFSFLSEESLTFATQDGVDEEKLLGLSCTPLILDNSSYNFHFTTQNGTQFKIRPLNSEDIEKSIDYRNKSKIINQNYAENIKKITKGQAQSIAASEKKKLIEEYGDLTNILHFNALGGTGEKAIELLKTTPRFQFWVILNEKNEYCGKLEFQKITDYEDITNSLEVISYIAEKFRGNGLSELAKIALFENVYSKLIGRSISYVSGEPDKPIEEMKVDAIISKILSNNTASMVANSKVSHWKIYDIRESYAKNEDEKTVILVYSEKLKPRIDPKYTALFRELADKSKREKSLSDFLKS